MMANEKKGKNTKMSPPWILFVKKLEALLGKDPEILIEYDNDQREVKLFVNNSEKADAMSKLIRSVYFFGEGVDLKVTIIPANAEKTKEDLFRIVFSRNPAVKDIIKIDDVFSSPLIYVMFKREVVQYFGDNLGDPHGNISTLYQDIAGDVFEPISRQGVFFCTDAQE